MKNELYLVFVSAMIVFSIAFLFHGDFNLTGRVVLDDSNENNSFINVTREMALSGMEESEKVIERMIQNNFSIYYMNDSLIEARRVFLLSDYEEIFSGRMSANKSQISDARIALSLVDLKKIGYSNVVVYTKDIISRENKAFEIYDSITVIRGKIDGYSSEGINASEARMFLESANRSFYNDRYSDAERFIQLSRDSLDNFGSEASIVGDLKRGLTGFIERYWAFIVLALVIIVIIWKIYYRRFALKRLNRRIMSIRADQKVLMSLMKSAQEERFKENSISGLVYNVRMKKYKEKLESLKQELPVLEARLKELVRNK